MSLRTTVFCLLAVLAAAVFVRLGFWQIARLHERQARNVAIAARERVAPAPLASLPRDSSAHHRRATLEGRFDYDHELVLTSRTRRGSPGVELFTPVRAAGTDTAVLVNRGWVYAPDGATVDRARWREGDTAQVSGTVELYAPDAGSTTTARDAHVIRRASRQEVAAKLPYPVAPYFLVMSGDSSTSHPARREPLALDDGPHRSYAFQWFSFAVIALVGGGVVARRAWQSERRA